MAPSGDRTTELEKLKEKAGEWAANLKRCNLNQEDIMHALQTTISKSYNIQCYLIRSPMKNVGV